LNLENPEDPNKPGKTTLDVEVYYDLGGMNYFTGRTDRRGYFLSVSPITRFLVGGGKSYLGFSGTHSLLLPANRFSQKVLEQVAATARQHEDYPKLVAHVCGKGNYILTEGQELAPKVFLPSEY
jgi:hypothetical protein